MEKWLLNKNIMSILSTKNLSKKFSGVHAVENISIGFESGKITSVIGPNGSGKSTLINIITGLSPITSGSIFIGKRTELASVESHKIADFGITRTFQNVRLFEQMKVIDNVLVVLTERSVSSALFEKHGKYHLEKAESVLRRVGLWDKRDELAANLSYGQRKLLEIARVLSMAERTDGEVQIVFFDEPFAGLFPEMRETIMSIMKELRDKGCAVVLVEHDMDIIRKLSDHVYVLDAGKYLASGTAEEVLSNKEVIEAYLGD